MPSKTTKQSSDKLFNSSHTSKTGKVECFGLQFATDADRRKAFLETLRERLKDASLRAMQGFPVGDDDAILDLSDPPFYTCCPNPFVADFIKEFGKPYDPQGDSYRCEPFAADVSEGKNDPIYNAHSYHTKVPHKAIMRYILHYTKPGDVVFDGFSGTGMTGVAAHTCGNPDDEFRKLIASDMPDAKWGERFFVGCDLSPAASYISHCYNTPFDPHLFSKEIIRILKEVQSEYQWAYETSVKGVSYPVEYFVFSDVFLCRNCAKEIVFLDAALQKDGSVVEPFNCPHCGAESSKRTMDRAFVTENDPLTNRPTKRTKIQLSLVVYMKGKERITKKAEPEDIALYEKSERIRIPDWFPTGRMSDGDEGQRNDPLGLTHVHHFFTRRALACMARLWSLANKASPDIRDYLRFTVEQNIWGMSRLARYVPTHFSQVNQYLSGTLYVGSQVVDVSPDYILDGKIRRLTKVLETQSRYMQRAAIWCGSLTNTPLPDNSIDYIFVDPPFGSNLSYSDLNFLWESWLGVRTNTSVEAIVSGAHRKGLPEYQDLMTACFKECARILKPGRWMTVEFHNSKNAVWMAIQEALLVAGFVVGDVRMLDKQHRTFKQITGAGAVKNDLIISAYRPSSDLEKLFRIEAGSESGAWEFVRSHLRQLPVFVGSGDELAETVAERTGHLLFDRMVAFHVQRGVSVPLSSAEFYVGLAQRFAERDGMFFLPDQAAEYDRKRAKVNGVRQLQLFVTDELSAIQWIRQRLTDKPHTFKELQPLFMKEVAGWDKHEQSLELMDLLRQNFLFFDGSGQVPNPIHAYLSSNYKELRNLPKDNATLREKAMERWYVPDPNKAGDLEKLRERSLLAEFEELKNSKLHNLKVFRTEAVRTGFKSAFDRRDYQTIVDVAGKLPEAVLQEDDKLLMYYDVASMRLSHAEKDNLF